MHVFSEKPIREAKEKWPQSASALAQWFRLAKENLSQGLLGDEIDISCDRQGGPVSCL